MTEVINILKVRDDHCPVNFEATGDARKFKLSAGHEPSWAGSQEFGLKELRSRIEPWLTSLFQSEHLSLMLGSGLTHAASITLQQTNQLPVWGLLLYQVM